MHLFFVYCGVWFQLLAAMSALEKFTLEFHIETTPKLLYTLIGTPDGLTRWFARTTFRAPDIFLFHWEGKEQPARLFQSKENEYVIFQWLEDYHKDYFLEMRIERGVNTSGVTLFISDYSDAVDVDVSKRLWQLQVGHLQRLFNA